MVTAGWRSADRNCCSARFPARGGTHRPTRVVVHRQKILGVEIRRVSVVCSRRDSVRDSSATAPICPCVLNARAAALRRSCSNGVA